MTKSSSSAVKTGPKFHLRRPLPVTSIQLAICATILLVVTIFPGIREASSAPVEVRILTVRDELLPAASMEGEGSPRAQVLLETPAELDSPPDVDAIPRFVTDIPGLEFGDVKALLVQQEQRVWIGSDPQKIEWYRLGPAGTAAPAPPAWTREFANRTEWKRMVPASTGADTPYLNRAVACWVADDPSSASASGDFLARVKFEVGVEPPLESALLHLAVRSEILGVFLNDRPVLTGPAQSTELQSFEISPMLQPGDNILAFWLRRRGGTVTPHPSLAFTVELVGANAPVTRLEADRRQAIVTTRQGDRIIGDILTFNPVSLLLSTAAGRYGADWTDVESVVFPRGWYDVAPPQSPMSRRFRQFFGLSNPDADLTDSLECFGVPLTPPGDAATGGILLADDRFVTDQPVAINDGSLMVRPADSEKTSEIRREKVVAIYPPSPDRSSLQRPSGGFAPLECRLRTVRGEVYSGIMRRVQSRNIVLEHAGDGFLSFHPKDVVWLWFSQHRDTLRSASEAMNGTTGITAAQRGARIAILQFETPKRPVSAKASIRSLELQEAGFLSGLDCVFPDAAVILDPARFTAQNYPVTAIIDPNGAYPDTLQTEGDARRAILAYVNSGGTLLVLSERGALERPLSTGPSATTSVANGTTSGTTSERAVLGRQLNLRTIAPADTGTSSLRAFDQPPNQGWLLQMQRTALPAPGLRSLPSAIEVPSLRSASFHPVVSTDASDEILYQLVSDTGTVFGPALLVARRGTGRVMVINHLLWDSSIEGRPFSKVVLPQLLSWAFELAR